MKGTFFFLVAAVVVILAVTAANAARRFTRAFIRDNQLHRVYFQVACGGGDKTARVKLMMKTMEVSLRNGSPAMSEIEHFYYTRKAIARRALRQARRGLGEVTCLKS